MKVRHLPTPDADLDRVLALSIHRAKIQKARAAWYATVETSDTIESELPGSQAQFAKALVAFNRERVAARELIRLLEES